ncbi:hypothetical protein AbraIFM66951_002600 [Aspergillus brasiliensis]|nr:hypothetical protein AbraIFM66951_002600 [Aspergillus brasiliensis]
MSEPGCPFEILPVELFFECVHYLDTVSVVHLSETCKTLSKILRHSRTERVSEHAFEYSEIILYPPLGSYVEVDDATIKEILSRPKKSSVRVDGFCPEGKCWEPVRCVPKTRIETVILKMMYSRLKSFLSAGLDPNSNLPGDEDDDGDKDDKRSSLLVTAIDYKDVEAVKILLQYGAKPTTLDDLLGYWPTNICPLMIGVLLDAGARPSSVHLATLLCELDGSPSPLIEFILNERLDVHCTYSGELEYTELTDATLLHIAAARGNPDLLEAIISRAPNQLHARVLGKSTSLGPRFLPGPRRFPDGESSEGCHLN